MSSNRLAFAAVGMACIASAAGGGYLATRQNTVPTPAAAMSPAATATPAAPVAPVPATAAPERPVQETEAVVADVAKKPAAAPKPTGAKRVESQGSAPRAANTSASASARPGQPPPLARTLPSSAASQPPGAPAMPAPTATVPSGSAAPRVEEPAPPP